jgi:hypothetical protein
MEPVIQTAELPEFINEWKAATNEISDVFDHGRARQRLPR